MKLTSRIKALRLLLALLLLISVASYYSFQKYTRVTNLEPYFVNWTWSEDISCHYVTKGDALQPVRYLTPPEDSIFFHETSCRGGLNSREACAVESAARKHPARSVYVFFNSPVSEAVLTRSCLGKLIQFENVRLARLHIEEYAQGTALRQMIADKENNNSEYRIEFTSDLLRYITLYKYGGVYLDTDVLVVKALDSLGKDWVAMEDDGKVVSVGVLGIGKESVGHYLVAQILQDLRSSYRITSWQYNGPGAMTRALVKLCNVTNFMDLKNKTCFGFKVYDRTFFYPIHYSAARSYFDYVSPEIYSLFQTYVNESYTHHFWNKVVRNESIAPDSLYDRMSKQHCPTIREMYGDQFGS